MSSVEDSGPKKRSWFIQHQHTMRDWLVLFAVVVAGVAGWQQIADERNARKDAEYDAQRLERRAQADEIGAWLGEGGGEGMNVALSNHSHQPVYQVVVSRVTIQANGPRTGREASERDQQAISVLPPGEYRIHFGPGFMGMGRFPGVEIAFRDQAGRTWVRYSNGLLREIDKSPIGYYDLVVPIYWKLPKKVG